VQPDFRVVNYRGYFYVAWREEGQTRRQALRTKCRTQADERLKCFIDEYEKASRPARITVEFIWNGYRESLGAKRAAVTMGFEAKSVLPHFGNISAETINEKDCLAYWGVRRSAGRKDGTIWTELGRLRTALSWAFKKGLINKAPYIPRPAPAPPKDLRLTREQATNFLAACPTPHVRLFVILAMTTGARMGALLELSWDRVDFASRTINLHDPERSRTNKGRATVPMNKTAEKALREAQEAALTKFVIEWNGEPIKSIKKGLRIAGQRSGMPWVTAHVFRHSVASWLAQDGVDLRKISELLGHTDSRTTEKIYSRFTPNFLRDAADALEF